MKYQCATCGQTHDDLPDLGSAQPFVYWDVPEKEREKRVQLTADTCVIDEDYFLRGVLEIPIRSKLVVPSQQTAQRLGLGVWISQKRENFEAYVKNPQAANIGPFFGWLCTRIGFYPIDTLSLKTMAHFRGGSLRPSIELEPTNHPLAVDQRCGITLDKAWQIVHWSQQQV